MITSPRKDGHHKIKNTSSRQQNTEEGIKLKKNTGKRSLSSKKDTKRSFEKSREKLKPQTKI